VLALELGAAFLAFLPRRARMVLAVLILVFQLGIMATGNYNWFNLLTILLCVFLLDDQALRPLMPRALVERIFAAAPRPGRLATLSAALLALLTVPIGVNLVWEPIAGRNIPIAADLAETIAPLLIVSSYGVFATTTTSRPGIIIEGSEDGASWKPYVLPYLPGPPDRAPAWNIPYQPRLDWQLWFASYGTAAQSRWIERLMLRLLQGSAPVLGLFAHDPYPDHPPKYVRAELYDYRFADPQTRAATGAVWTRTLDGMYFPQVSLKDFAHAPSARAPMPRAVVPGPGAAHP
jgi:hypothetical protein